MTVDRPREAVLHRVAPQVGVPHDRARHAVERRVAVRVRRLDVRHQPRRRIVPRACRAASCRPALAAIVPPHDDGGGTCRLLRSEEAAMHRPPERRSVRRARCSVPSSRPGAPRAVGRSRRRLPRGGRSRRDRPRASRRASGSSHDVNRAFCTTIASRGRRAALLAGGRRRRAASTPRSTAWCGEGARPRSPRRCTATDRRPMRMLVHLSPLGRGGRRPLRPAADHRGDRRAGDGAGAPREREARPGPRRQREHADLHQGDGRLLHPREPPLRGDVRHQPLRRAAVHEHRLLPTGHRRRSTPRTTRRCCRPASRWSSRSRARTAAPG